MEDLKLLRALFLLVVLSTLVFIYQANLRFESTSIAYEARIQLPVDIALNSHLTSEFTFKTISSYPLHVTLSLVRGVNDRQLSLIVPAVAAALEELDPNSSMNGAELFFPNPYFESSVTILVSKMGFFEKLNPYVEKAIDEFPVKSIFASELNSATMSRRIQAIKERCIEKWLPIKMTAKDASGNIVASVQRLKMQNGKYSLTLANSKQLFRVGDSSVKQVVYWQALPYHGENYNNCEIEFVPSVATFDILNKTTEITTINEYFAPDSFDKEEIEAAVKNVRGTPISVATGVDMQSVDLLFLVPILHVALSIAISITLRRLVSAQVPLSHAFFYEVAGRRQLSCGLSKYDGVTQRMIEVGFRGVFLIVVVLAPPLTVLSSIYFQALPELFTGGGLLTGPDHVALSAKYWEYFFSSVPAMFLLMVSAIAGVAAVLTHQAFHQGSILLRSDIMKGMFRA